MMNYIMMQNLMDIMKVIGYVGGKMIIANRGLIIADLKLLAAKIA